MMQGRPLTLSHSSWLFAAMLKSDKSVTCEENTELKYQKLAMVGLGVA